MRSLLVLILCFGLVNVSWAETGLEEGHIGKKSNYLFSPYGESELTGVLNISQIELDGDNGTSSADSSLGFGINVDMGEGASKLVSGLHYMQFKSDSAGGVKNKLSYLMIPLGLKHYVSGAEAGLYFRGGVNPMILIKGESGANDDVFTSMDLLGNVGVGFRIPGGAQDFSLEVSYNQGLLDINDTNSGVEVNNKGLIFSLGVSL